MDKIVSLLRLFTVELKFLHNSRLERLYVCVCVVEVVGYLICNVSFHVVEFHNPRENCV